MKNKPLQKRINQEVLALLEHQQSAFIASLNKDGLPHASYAPFVYFDDDLYILISGLAAHTQYLIAHPHLSLMVVADESASDEVFARLRVSYDMVSEVIPRESDTWHQGIEHLHGRFGERIVQLSQLGDFVLFKLSPKAGRFVKGFGRAYELLGGTLAGEEVVHLSPQALVNGKQL